MGRFAYSRPNMTRPEQDEEIWREAKKEAARHHEEYGRTDNAGVYVWVENQLSKRGYPRVRTLLDNGRKRETLDRIANGEVRWVLGALCKG